MEQKILDDLQAGTFEEPLFKCELRQRDKVEPRVFKGQGLVCQDDQRRLVIKVFTDIQGLPYWFGRGFDQTIVPGKLVPDSKYYDFIGTDLHGNEWTAEHLSINPRNGLSGTFITAIPRRLEKSYVVETIQHHYAMSAFIPGTLELPWFEKTEYGYGDWALDRFTGEYKGYE